MKSKPSKLDAFAERLDEWFGLEKKTLAQVQEQLKLDGCIVSLSRLSSWWEDRQTHRMQESLLAQITSGARQCKDVETQFAATPAPELETLIKLHRVLIMKLSTQANADPSLVETIFFMMKNVLEYSKIQEKRKDREFAESKYRDKVLEQKQKIESALESSKGKGGLTAETLKTIEEAAALL
jgi:hypothetical protein